MRNGPANQSTGPFPGTLPGRRPACGSTILLGCLMVFGGCRAPPGPFVKVVDGRFQLEGRPHRFVGAVEIIGDGHGYVLHDIEVIGRMSQRIVMDLLAVGRVPERNPAIADLRRQGHVLRTLGTQIDR